MPGDIQSQVRMSTHMQNPQHMQNIARAKPTVYHAIIHVNFKCPVVVVLHLHEPSVCFI